MSLPSRNASRNPVRDAEKHIPGRECDPGPTSPSLTVVLIGFESLVSLFGTKTMLWAFVSAAGFHHFIFVQSVCFVIGSSLWFSFPVFSILSHSHLWTTPSKLAPLPLSWCSVYNTRVLRATEKRQCFCLGLAYFT